MTHSFLKQWAKVERILRKQLLFHKWFVIFDSIMVKALLNFDRSLFSTINQTWSNPVFDVLMPFIRNQFFWVPVYLFLLAFMVLNFRKKAGWWVLFFLATFALTDMISTQVIKAFIERPRPCADVFTSDTARMLIPCSYSFSFVSSHAANHFGIAMFVFMTLKQISNRSIWLLFVWAFVVCYAQVYVGAHFPFDVLGGALLGLFIGHRTAIIFNRQFKPLTIH